MSTSAGLDGVARFAKRNRWYAAVTSCVVLLVLIAHNVYWFKRNQRELPPHERHHRSSTDLTDVAFASGSRDVRGTLAIYHLLSKHIEGSAFTIPPGWAGTKDRFEHVAGLRVSVSEEPLIIDSDRVRKIRKGASAQHRWFLGRKRNGRFGYKDLYFVFRGRSDYVLAEGSNGEDLFVLPREMFEARKIDPQAVSP